MIFKRRRIEPEVLDHLPAEEARPNLADIVRINRNFGGHAVLLDTLGKVLDAFEAATILDVGAASGDSAVLIRERYPLTRVTSLDLHWTNLERAPQPKLIGDAFGLPFRAGSFHIVLCSLFLHHFSDDQVVDILHGFGEVAKTAVVVCDLERHVLPWLFLPVTRRIFGWNDVTVSDGVKSVRAAFRAEELADLAGAAGFAHVETQTYRPAFRIGMIARKA